MVTDETRTTVLDTMQARLIVEEGEMPFMYLDKGGTVTCGVGHALPNPAAAMVLPWRWGDAGPRATEEEIRAEYAAVFVLHAGLLPMYYAMKTKLRLTSADVEALLASDVEGVEGTLRTALPEFVRFPAAAQVAMIDMAFQVGVHGLLEKFPRLIACAKAGDWKGATAECHRIDASPARNAETISLFAAATAYQTTVAA
jgi:GH24 family phage-related lysozyme (muramidase)